MKKKDPTSHRIIEKRRRDRMNNCLADLSKLIPDVYMKKRSGRIEKTEIIEMAIKYLKDLIEISDAQQLKHHQQQQQHQYLQQQQQKQLQHQDQVQNAHDNSCAISVNGNHANDNNGDCGNNKFDSKRQLHQQLDQQLQIQARSALGHNENLVFNNCESTPGSIMIDGNLNNGSIDCNSSPGSNSNSSGSDTKSPSPSSSTTSASSLASTSATIGSSVNEDSLQFTECHQKMPTIGNEYQKNSHQSRYHQSRLTFSTTSSSTSMKAHNRSSPTSSSTSGFDSRSSSSSFNGSSSGNRSSDSSISGCCTCGAKILSVTNMNSGNVDNINGPVTNGSSSQESSSGNLRVNGTININTNGDNNNNNNQNFNNPIDSTNSGNVDNNSNDNNSSPYPTSSGYLGSHSSRSSSATGWSKKAWLVRSFSRAASQQR